MIVTDIEGLRELIEMLEDSQMLLIYLEEAEKEEAEDVTAKEA